MTGRAGAAAGAAGGTLVLRSWRSFGAAQLQLQPLLTCSAAAAAQLMSGCSAAAQLLLYVLLLLLRSCCCCCLLNFSVRVLCVTEEIVVFVNTLI